MLALGVWYKENRFQTAKPGAEVFENRNLLGGGAAESPVDPLIRSAISGENQLAANLVAPKLPKGIAGFFGPEDDAEGSHSAGADARGFAVEDTVRGRRMHAIDVTGWGVAPPQGYVPDDTLLNTWKPARGDPADSRIFIKSGPACRPSCPDRTVDDSALTRGIVASRRAYNYACPRGVRYGGKYWRYSDFSLIKLRGETCVTMALLSRTSESRRQAAGVFLRMRDSLQPLPRRPMKPMLEERLKDKKIRLLR
ncbi:MAG: hypothetical protein ABII00_18620 [Elusimicrobiota bacterium]